ncbi:MAG: hypothetical protein R3A12_08235 [Ignavibacteria bacterium]
MQTSKLKTKLITIAIINPIIMLPVAIENTAKLNAERFMNPSIEILIT